MWSLFYIAGRLSSYGIIREVPQMPPLSDLPSHYSTKLPKAENYFVGRSDEIRMITGYLDFHESPVQIIGIFGGPGIGKSTLAIKAGHMISGDNVTVEYFDLSEVLFVPHLLHKILGGMINSTEHSVMMEKLKCWTEENSVKPKVLIFDGCDKLLNSNQKGVVQEIFSLVMKHSDQVKIIFTSKHVVAFVSQFKKITLEELHLAHAVELLRTLNSRLSEKDAIKIAKAVGNIPLALQIVGAVLETDSLSPQHIINQITINPLKVLNSKALPSSHQVQTSLQLSFDHLDDEYYKLCACFLANFPGSFSHDAAVSVLTYMTNATYWYAMMFHELNIFLNWVPKPSHCLEILVHRSLLKYHSNSHRYSFHKLVRMFLLSNQSQDSDDDIMFKKGFVYYFAKYWDSFHKYARKGKYDSQIIAALDLERHNFEFVEKILPELGLDISYVNRYTESAELYASYTESLMDYLRHIKKKKTIKKKDTELMAVDSKETTTLKNRRKILMLIDLHSRAVIANKGPRRYMEIFVEMIIQVSILEDYTEGPKAAIENLKSRKGRIIELHKEYGDDVQKSVEKYFDQMKNYSLEVGDIDALMEALQVKIGFSWPVEKGYRSNFKKGRAYFGAQNYEKAIKHYTWYFTLNKDIPEHEYLYTIVMLYYCHHFGGDQENAIGIAQYLDTTETKRILHALKVNEKNYKKVEIILLFYGKVRPGTAEHSILSQKFNAYDHPIAKIEIERLD